MPDPTKQPTRLLTTAQRRRRRAEFERVTEFLDELGYHLGRGYGREEEVAHHGGHTQEHLAKIYEDPERSRRRWT